MDKKPNEYQIGDEDHQGSKITKIFYKAKDYVIYQIEDTSDIKTFSKKGITQSLSKLYVLIDELRMFNANKRRLQRFPYIVARAYYDCFEGRDDLAASNLKDIIQRYIRLRGIGNRTVYLLSSFIFLLLNVIGYLLLIHLSANLEKFLFFYTLAICGALGGFLSIAIRLPSLELDHYENYKIQIINGAIRIIISMISAIGIYIIILSKLALGFIEEIDNNYVYFAFAFLSGFSEYFVPNILRRLEQENTPIDPSENENSGSSDKSE